MSLWILQEPNPKARLMETIFILARKMRLSEKNVDFSGCSIISVFLERGLDYHHDVTTETNSSGYHCQRPNRKKNPFWVEYMHLLTDEGESSAVSSMVHVAAAGSAAFFSSELCCTSSLLGGEPVSFQLLLILMVKIAGSMLIGFQ